MSVLPIGEAAVGVEVAKDFGDDEGGVFQGVVVSVWLQGKRLAHDLSYNNQIFDDDGSDHEVSGKGVKVWLPWVNQQP